MSLPLFPRGLVVGKFAPLHRGHELLLEHATAACRELFIISWSRPEFPGCGPARRARWLADRFPNARRLVLTPARLRARLPGLELPRNDDPDETKHRLFVGLVCREFFGLTGLDAVFTSEDYGEGFAAELSRFFSCPVRHVLVDLARQTVPISGTALRADPHAGRAWLDPTVYASFVRRVVLLGGESTGKTTLAAALAAHLGTVQVPEYGRELWELRGGQLRFADMLAIGREQVAREKLAARRANHWLVCDTAPLTTLFYSRAMFEGHAARELEQLARRRYDATVLCAADDIPFEQDGTRQDPAFRDRQHAWYLAELTRLRRPFLTVSGSVTQRVHAAAAYLTTPPLGKS